MLNRAPIIINGYAHGGTNLIANILVSHPDICLLSGDTHQVFHGKAAGPIRLAASWPLNLAAGGRVMSSGDFFERRPLSRLALRYMDLIFYVDKMISPKNRDKSEGVPYRLAEKGAARFLAKSLNGAVLANDIFAAAYPDATFIAIIRDGLATCEGYSRRGRSVEQFARTYELIHRKILHDSRTLNNYHVVRYEDMVADPVGFMRRIYPFAGLDTADVPKVRLQAKLVTRSDGTRDYAFGSGRDREVKWFPVEELPQYVTAGANENQRRRLPEQDRETFIRIAGGAMRELGYEL